MSDIKLLDCTLRDGAYLVNKKFGDDVIKGIIEGLVNAKIDCIEAGFLQDNEYGEGKTVYKSISDAKRFIPKDKNGIIFTLLSDYGKFDMNNLEDYDSESIDAIRMCFKKDERFKMVEGSKIIKERGYKLFLQPVNVLGYSDQELLELINIVNDIEPYSFAIVDTFGSMYQEDLRRVFKTINDNLKPSIKIGFHSHNNLQMSNALSQEMVRIANGRRDIIIDGTISGMGRGAGNTPIELIAEYLNKKWNCQYNIDSILDLIDDYMNNIKTKCSWGYTTPYFIAGCYGTHADNIKYLISTNSIRSKDIRNIIDILPPEARIKFNREKLESTYLAYLNSSKENNDDLGRLMEEMTNREILVVAPGNSVVKEKKQLIEFINNSNPIVISIGFIPTDFKCDYVYLGNIRRFDNLINKPEYHSVKKIITSNIKSAKNDDKEYIIDYVKSAKFNNEVVGNSTITLLNLLDLIPIQSINIAGFDGYDYYPKNYASEDLELSNVCENPREMNSSIAKMLLNYLINRKNDAPFKFVTDSKFKFVVNVVNDALGDNNTYKKI